MSRRAAAFGVGAVLGLSGDGARALSLPAGDFRIAFGDADLRDLRQRLRTTRWNDAVTTDWAYGTERGFLQDLVRHWAEDYDWPSRQARLNRLPHRRLEIDGFGVHCLHFRGVSPDRRALLLMNGWPSSIVEFEKLVPLLTSGADGLDVVIPTLPGFGFSDRPQRPYEVEPVDLFAGLMSHLGYDRFFVAGTDIGAGVATRLALRFPHRVLGVHVSSVAEKPMTPAAPPPTMAERAYDAADEVWTRDEGGYQAIQSSRPQTLAFGLADSPTGLASWILEKFRAWSDCGGDVYSVFPRDVLLDNLMVYWITGTIGSSVRYYYEASRLRPPLRANDFVAAPTAVAVWPHDLAQAPRERAERLYNVVQYTAFPGGGHFPAWERPADYAADIRRLVDTVQPGSP